MDIDFLSISKIFRRKNGSLARIIEIKTTLVNLRYYSNATGMRNKIYFWISYLITFRFEKKYHNIILHIHIKIYIYKYSVNIEY